LQFSKKKKKQKKLEDCSRKELAKEESTFWAYLEEKW
jgi:hypothetical protein